MKKLGFYFLLNALLFAFLMVSCKDDFDYPLPEPEVEVKPRLNVSDSLTLIKIYEALGPWDGERWDYSDYTTWAGLTAAYDVDTKEIRAVGLQVYGGIKGTLPDEICDLTELRCLDLIGGEGRIPENIGKLKHLQYLRLCSNQLRGGIPESIGNLRELKELRLMGSLLDDTIPESIGKLTNMEDLVIFDTQMKGNIPRGIANWSKLRRVVLKKNHFSGSVPIEILANKHAGFSFEENDITELPWEVWDDNFDAKPPYLVRNRLSGEIPSWVLKTKKWQDYHYVVGKQQDGYGYSYPKE